MKRGCTKVEHLAHRVRLAEIVSGPRVLNRGSRFTRIPEGARSVSRPSRWGKPFPLNDPDDGVERAEVVRLHREWVLTSDEPITIGTTTIIRAASVQTFSNCEATTWRAAGTADRSPWHALHELANRE